jgi:ring-1,2-phenylacetyl-CoA epoxidase subunit PaaD
LVTGGAHSQDRTAAAWAVLADVLDPEVPALSVCDLGIVRSLRWPSEPEGPLEVTLTPTYSGCPATEVISESVRAALADAGFGPVQVRLQRSPAWTTDWISAAGRDKLRAYGIAPPQDAAGPGCAVSGLSAAPQPIHLMARDIPCPRCDSPRSERLSAFGSTACKSLYRCLACREPFEYFKPL